MADQQFEMRAKRVRVFLDTNKRLPSYREMLELFEVKSKNAVFQMVQKMIDAGLLEKDSEGKLVPRSMRKGLRILGTVQAGFPTHAEEEIADIVSLDDFLITDHQASFLLKVSGDSMIDAGIQPGDFVVLERGKNPRNGDIVVAEVDHEWTMKFFEKKGRVVVLRPANKLYPPIMPRSDMSVAGVVTAVIRKYRR